MATSWRLLTTRLSDEWESLAADMPASAWRRWKQECPVLQGVDQLIELPEWLPHQGYPVKDAVLLALVRWMQEGSPFAGLTVLHLMMPGLSSTYAAIMFKPNFVRTGSSPEHGEEIIAAFWDVMGAYPVRARPARVAANLLLDTQRAFRRGARPFERYEMPAEPGLLDHLHHSRDVVVAAGQAPEGPEDKLLGRTDSAASLLEDLLGWAVAAKVIEARDADLLRDLCSPVPGEQLYSYDVAAQTQGVTVPAARQRACRALRRIRAAAAEQGITPLTAPDSWPRPKGAAGKELPQVCHTRLPQIA